MRISIKGTVFQLFFCFAFTLNMPSAFAFKFIPPKNIVSKETLPIKELNLIRTEQGLTYLISQDGRYVFQGPLIDVWNGRAIESIEELNGLSDQVDFKYLGISSEKMFSLDLGSGPDEVFIFSDPNCGICHTLLKKIKASRLIQDNFRVHAVITPILNATSMEKSNQLARVAQTDPVKALDIFIQNDYENEKAPKDPSPGIKYNLVVARALGIQNVPYIVNSKGRIHIGMPDDISLFLLKESKE